MQIIQNYNYKSYNLFGSFNANKKFSKKLGTGRTRILPMLRNGEKPTAGEASQN